MSTETLERRFAAIGARIVVAPGMWRGAPRIDVKQDRRGEYFDLRFTGGGSNVDVEVVDAQARHRHLLLLARIDGEKSKFLCGHDERHWFVAAIPESERSVRSVETAIVALRPGGVDARDPFRRRNADWVRQGEWFFVAVPGIDPPEAVVLRDEPLTRGVRGKPHVLQFAYRRGGDVVYVSRRHPAGISEARFSRLTDKQQRSGSWRRTVRDPELYARGTVRHPDHATLRLHTWHRVLMNTEHGAQAMRHVAFID